MKVNQVWRSIEILTDTRWYFQNGIDSKAQWNYSDSKIKFSLRELPNGEIHSASNVHLSRSALSPTSKSHFCPSNECWFLVLKSLVPLNLGNGLIHICSNTFLYPKSVITKSKWVSMKATKLTENQLVKLDLYFTSGISNHILNHHHGNIITG